MYLTKELASIFWSCLHQDLCWLILKNQPLYWTLQNMKILNYAEFYLDSFHLKTKEIQHSTSLNESQSHLISHMSSKSTIFSEKLKAQEGVLVMWYTYLIRNDKAKESSTMIVRRLHFSQNTFWSTKIISRNSNSGLARQKLKNWLTQKLCWLSQTQCRVSSTEMNMLKNCNCKLQISNYWKNNQRWC